MPRRLLHSLALALTGGLALVAVAVPPKDPTTVPEKPNVDADKARAAVTVPKGMTVELWAAEPLMANPVAVCFDEQGRAYVAETTRFANGVPDTRNYMYWLDEDIGSRSVEDRLKMYENNNAPLDEAFEPLLPLHQANTSLDDNTVRFLYPFFLLLHIRKEEKCN